MALIRCTRQFKPMKNVLISKMARTSQRNNSQTSEDRNHRAAFSQKQTNSQIEAVTEVTVKITGLPIDPPDNCCMSGCATCVWIQYANELTDYFKDGGETAKKAIEQIQDENMKAFLRMELKL